MTTIIKIFEGYGVELEYMIVDRTSMAVLAIADRLFEEAAGEGAYEFDAGTIGWSNELALHVVELKNNTPRATLTGLGTLFHEQVIDINRRLARHDASLLPGGMHPFMHPLNESRLWPAAGNEIYRTYDRIFNCKGHGWTNLQSIHCNISFADDDEFKRLHTALRLMLPLLPALCASTPFVDGSISGLMDTRLEYYRNNQKIVPSVTGRVIPELVFSRDEYENKILVPMYREVAAYDPEKVIQYEWLNSRGAIARFDRMAIEIRLMDIQECPAADVAVCALVIEVARALVEERWSPFEQQCRFTERELESILLKTIRDAGATIIEESDYLRVMGIGGRWRVTALDLWRSLAHAVLPAGHWAREGLNPIMQNGTLAQRMVRSTGNAPGKNVLIDISKQLCGCLQENRHYA